MEAYYFSLKGKRVNNQDSLLINKLLINNVGVPLKRAQNINKVLNKFLISDGMGGLECGEVASKIILESFQTSFRKFNINFLENLIYSAAIKIREYSNKNNIQIRRIGGTIAGVIIKENKMISFNVGDTRIYKISKKEVSLISKDHSFAQKLYEEGEISEEVIRFHKSKNILTSCLSNEIPLSEIKINFKTSELEKGDIIFICSDGVWEHLNKKIIKKIFSYKKLENSIKKIIELVEKDPGDNYSLIAIKI